MADKYIHEFDKITELSDGDVLLVDQEVSPGDYATKGITGESIKQTIQDKLNFIGNKRLSLVSNTPYPTASSLASTNLYWTDGSTNLTVAVPNTTATNYDVFWNKVDNDLSTVNWATGTARATGLARDDWGYYVKDGDEDEIYLGTGRTHPSLSGQTDSNVGMRFLWNYYNRRSQILRVMASTSHTNTDTSIIYWNNDSNNKVEFVVGVYEEDIALSVLNQMTCAATSSTTQGCIGLGINSVAALSAISYWASAFNMRSAGLTSMTPNLGYNFVAALERGLTGCTFQLVQVNGLFPC